MPLHILGVQVRPGEVYSTSMKIVALSVDEIRSPTTAWYSGELYHFRACSLLSNSNRITPWGPNRRRLIRRQR